MISEEVNFLSSAMDPTRPTYLNGSAWQRVPLEGGGEQPILCLHGSNVSSLEFEPLTRRVPHGCHLVIVNWLERSDTNEAQSSSAELQSPLSPSVSFLDQCTERLDAIVREVTLAARTPIVLTSGFASAPAIRFAAANPDALRALVLCQPGGLIPALYTSPSLPIRPPAPARPSADPFPSLPAGQLPRPPLRRPVFAAPHESAEIEAALHEALPGLRADLLATAPPILFALARESHRYRLGLYETLLTPLLESAPRHRAADFPGGSNPLWDSPVRFAKILNSFVQALLPLNEHQHAWLLSAVDYPARDLNLWKCAHPECSAEQILEAEEDAN